MPDEPVQMGGAGFTMKPMPDNHPPLTAVAAALGEAFPAWLVRSDFRTTDVAGFALRALDTDQVREWAKTVPCLRWADLSPDPAVCYSGPEPGLLVHPECLLAALARGR